MPIHPLLESINDPADLRRLARAELPQLARELRAFLLNTVAQTGGHLSSNLGTVELTIALHYVFDTPRDRIVWDVGHQTYAHKILTGRRAQMNKLRQWGGPAGFPRRDESPYDTFGTAHSSTSISAALGMAVAASLDGRVDPPANVRARNGPWSWHGVTRRGEGYARGAVAPILYHGVTQFGLALGIVRTPAAKRT